MAPTIFPQQLPGTLQPSSCSSLEQSSSPSLLSRPSSRSPTPPQPSARPKMTIYRGRCTFSIGMMKCQCAMAEADYDSDFVCHRCSHKFSEHEDISPSASAIPAVADTIAQGTRIATLPLLSMPANFAAAESHRPSAHCWHP